MHRLATLVCQIWGNIGEIWKLLGNMSDSEVGPSNGLISKRLIDTRQTPSDLFI